MCSCISCCLRLASYHLPGLPLRPVHLLHKKLGTQPHRQLSYWHTMRVLGDHQFAREGHNQKSPALKDLQRRWIMAGHDCLPSCLPSLRSYIKTTIHYMQLKRYLSQSIDTFVHHASQVGPIISHLLSCVSWTWDSSLHGSQFFF